VNQTQTSRLPAQLFIADACLLRGKLRVPPPEVSPRAGEIPLATGAASINQLLRFAQKRAHFELLGERARIA
jgi:hypothetical protein